jgi:hypothetical protein
MKDVKILFKEFVNTRARQLRNSASKNKTRASEKMDTE